MPLFSWLLTRMTGRPHTRRILARKPTTRFRPQLEALEGRDLPSFGTPVVYSTYGTQALATADMNTDGKPDLIRLDQGNAVDVWLNNGNGSFVPSFGSGTESGGGIVATALAVYSEAGTAPIVVVANYPPDGGPYGETDGISVLQFNSTGSRTFFGTYDSVIPSGGIISSLATADLAGNGVVSYVAADGLAIYVAPIINGRAQTYAVPAADARGGSPLQLAVADFNGDGKPDIVAAGAGNASVFLNKGDGTFADPQAYAVAGSPTSVAVGDCNRDGKLDIVTGNADGTVSVLLNNGTGAFGAAQSFAIAGPASSVAVGDFNQDGFLDVVTTGAEMDLLLNNGQGAFGPYQTVGPAGSNVLATDFTADGFPDLAEISPQAGASVWNAIDVLYNNPHGSLTGAGFPSSTTAGVAHSFTVTALNADGTVNTGYTGTVHFSSSDPQAGLPANYKFTAADQGVHTFSVTLKTAGSQQFITATDTNNTSLVGGELGITVAPAAAVALVFGNVPSGLKAGDTFDLWLTAKDAYGNVATSYSGTVQFTCSDLQAVLPANYTFSSGTGQAGFPVTFKTAGTQTLSANDTVTSSLTVTANNILIRPAPPAHLLVSAPASVSSGSKFSLTVTVVDAYGNVETGAGNIIYVTTLHFTSSDSTATLPKDYTFSTAGAEAHTFSKSFILKKKGTQTITVTVPGDGALTTTMSINVT
jgi:hypothetical protein